MANELQITNAFIYNNGGAFASTNQSGYFTVGTNKLTDGVITATTSDSTLSVGGVSTIGYVFIKNLDATNYITIGSDGTNYPLKLKAGETSLFRWNASAVHVKANTASCLIQYTIISD